MIKMIIFYHILSQNDKILSQNDKILSNNENILSKIILDFYLIFKNINLLGFIIDQ